MGMKRIRCILGVFAAAFVAVLMITFAAPGAAATTQSQSGAPSYAWMNDGASSDTIALVRLCPGSPSGPGVERYGEYSGIRDTACARCFDQGLYLEKQGRVYSWKCDYDGQLKKAYLLVVWW